MKRKCKLKISEEENGVFHISASRGDFSWIEVLALIELSRAEVLLEIKK